MKPRALLKRVGTRLLAGLGVMWGASTFAFLTLHLTAGDAALATVAGNGADPTEAIVNQVRQSYGLNLPLWQQYLDYLLKLLQGNLGQSFQQRIPVSQAIAMQIGGTIQLALMAVVIAVVLAIVVSVLTARRADWVRSLSSTVERVLASAPTFVIGLVLLIVFSLELKIFPSSGQEGFRALVLPSLTLALPIASVLTQVLRNELEEVLEQPFILTARARGMHDLAVRVRHALRHAAIPLVTMSGQVVGALMGGAVIVESLFNRQGLGQIMLTATTNKDIPMVTGVVLFAAFVYVVINLIVDIAYTAIDPRVLAR